jgi:predicted RNase H-like HicB family nuclease
LNYCEEVGYVEYTIIFHKAEEGGYWAEVPALPGCYSQGESVEETMKNIKEAIESHLEALREDKQEIPTEGEFIIGKVKVAI